LFGSLTVGLKQEKGNAQGPDKDHDKGDDGDGDGADFNDLLPDSLK